MTNFKKRRCSNGEVDDDVTEESSYCKVKARLKKKEAELEQVCVRLQCTEQRIKEVETHFEQAIKVLQDTLRQKEDLALELTVVRSELDHEINVNENIVNGINKENRRLKSSMGMLRLRIERLTTSVVDGSDAYDRMAAKLSSLKNEKAKHNVKMKVAERAALRHFGLSKTTANPLLFRAAVGFCSGCTTVVEKGEARIGNTTRKDI